MQMTYRELKDEIAKIIPRNIEYEIDLEAGNIAIITANMKPFTGQDGLIGKIARRVKRKIVLRTPIETQTTFGPFLRVILAGELSNTLPLR